MWFRCIEEIVNIEATVMAPLSTPVTGHVAVDFVAASEMIESMKAVAKLKANEDWKKLESEKPCLLHIVFNIYGWMPKVVEQGYSSFLLRDLPFDAIQFCIYEQLRIGYKIAGFRLATLPRLDHILEVLIFNFLRGVNHGYELPDQTGGVAPLLPLSNKEKGRSKEEHHKLLNGNFVDTTNWVNVQSDPAGHLIISGEPDQPDNPWGVTSFKKVVTLPSRIDPRQTSVVVTLHGQLFVCAPFDQPSL